MAGRRATAPNPAGAHFLGDRGVVTELIQVSSVGEGDYVFDLGAGTGVLTAALAATGAHVTAIERDERLVARLRRRFQDAERVRIVGADLRNFRVPRRRYHVVANPPFSITTTLLRRMLGDVATRLMGADLVVEWGMGRRLTHQCPRDHEAAWWAARFDMRLLRRIPALSFQPPPSVNAAHLSIRPRPIAVSRYGQKLLRHLLKEAYRSPRPSLDHTLRTLPPKHTSLSRRQLRRLLADLRLDPHAPAAVLTGEQWNRLTLLLTTMEHS